MRPEAGFAGREARPGRRIATARKGARGGAPFPPRYDQGYGELETGCRSPVTNRSKRNG